MFWDRVAGVYDIFVNVINKNVTFLQGNILSLDFADETFDKVVAGNVIKDADQILVVSDGEIIERGDHASLMNENGTYANMFSLQNK